MVLNWHLEGTAFENSFDEKFLKLQRVFQAQTNESSEMPKEVR